MNKKIAFLLPTRSPNAPIGGYKVVYEYANGLSNKGYDVTIIYPLTINSDSLPLSTIGKSILKYLKWKLSGMTGRKWFNLHHTVSEKIVMSLNYKFLKGYDSYISTQVETAFPLANYPVKNKFYLIQDYEAWLLSDEEVKKSYLLGLHNIVISEWLLSIVNETGANATLIKNGFDFNYFRLSQKIEDRYPKSITMLYHYDERKGCKYGLKALEKLKHNYSDLRVRLFGVPPRPTGLPEWMEYFQKPDKETHNRIYNETAIFLAPSVQEGWGLTVGEAMICGAAVVCSEAKGFKEMITDNETGIVTATKNIDDIYEKISFLIENSNQRIAIAKRGNEYIKQFTWANSINQLQNLLEMN